MMAIVSNDLELLPVVLWQTREWKVNGNVLGKVGKKISAKKQAALACE